jgi:hypothetical protein
LIDLSDKHTFSLVFFVLHFEELHCGEQKMETCGVVWNWIDLAFSELSVFLRLKRFLSEQINNTLSHKIYRKTCFSPASAAPSTPFAPATAPAAPASAPAAPASAPDVPNNKKDAFWLSQTVEITIKLATLTKMWSLISKLLWKNRTNSWELNQTLLKPTKIKLESLTVGAKFDCWLYGFCGVMFP